MILSPISFLDCFAFLVFLFPQILLHAPVLQLLGCALNALPFFLVRLPFGYIQERLFYTESSQTPFARRATWFQDLVVRCVRYAFANIPASIGYIFFSKAVALPFMHFRMLRHGYLRCPIHWEELQERDFKGLWLIHDSEKNPDLVIYYMHGGGFSMGSSYFYLEFLLAWLALLVEQLDKADTSEDDIKSKKGYSNPAILALDYDLVPHSVYPKQLNQTLAGYEFILSKLAGGQANSTNICVAGDSAGGTLVLSLLLKLGERLKENIQPTLPLPGLAILLSPWCSLTESYKNTISDYLNATTLSIYARQYLSSEWDNNSIASPGDEKDVQVWRRSQPSQGFLFVYGGQEVFAEGICDLIHVLEKARVSGDKKMLNGAHSQAHVRTIEQWDHVHAWPVVDWYTDSRSGRADGLQRIVKEMVNIMVHSR